MTPVVSVAIVELFSGNSRNIQPREPPEALTFARTIGVKGFQINESIGNALYGDMYQVANGNDQ